VITFDGDNKRIILSGSTAFTALAIYSAAKVWEDDVDHMVYVSPMGVSGKALLASDIYTDAIFSLTNGWKLQPAGYASGTQLFVSGTLITDDGSAKTVVPDEGHEVTWNFQATTAATMVAASGGGGGTAPTVEEIAEQIFLNTYVEAGLNVLNAQKIITAALAGEIEGMEDFEPVIKAALSKLKNRIRAETDEYGNRSNITFDLS
jgi:hypothetical protein